MSRDPSSYSQSCLLSQFLLFLKAWLLISSLLDFRLMVLFCVSFSVDLALQQNIIMDVFVDDFLQLAEEETNFSSKSDSSLKEYQSFTDLEFSKDKTITCVNWHPSIKGLYLLGTIC